MIVSTKWHPTSIMEQSVFKWFIFAALVTNISSLNGVWKWECKEGHCQKSAITNQQDDTARGLAACQLFCSDVASIWPKPTGAVDVGDTLAKVNVNSVEVSCANSETSSYSLAVGASKRFKEQISGQVPSRSRIVDGGKTLEVTCITVNPNVHKLALSTEEGYTVTVQETADGRLNATISADNFFGTRNGLETLSQLMIYDELRDEVQIPNQVSITDMPVYPYRGILLDTSRNYVSVEGIKRTLEAMGSSKLNSFHWHITDSHSFPYVSECQPDLSRYGAYSQRKIYSPEDVKEIVEYGLLRGVRIIPEFDAPAHVGEGWQNTDFVTCFNAKPWQSFCVEPPCGQFDPTKDKLYDVLEDLYGDMLKDFEPLLFHMGGDEVHFGCWNNTPNIVDWMAKQGWGRAEEDFVKLWDRFQSQALTRLYKKAGNEDIPIIMWTSTLTHTEYLHYLPKDKYVIQIWTTTNDPQIATLLDNGYKVILSNYDALYLDCGFAGWVTDGNNWCSPYVGWQKIYTNTPIKIAGDKKKQVLGAEATLWSEQADTANVDSRLWPRAAALSEVLWSEPSTGWRHAESRILIHRERLISRGINSDAIEPEWCIHYEENCPMDARLIDDVDNENTPQPISAEEDDNETSPSGGVTTNSITFNIISAIIIDLLFI